MGLSELIFTWIFQGKKERAKLHNPANISFNTLTASSKIKVSLGIHSGQFSTCLGLAHHFSLSQKLAGNAEPGAGQADGQGLHQALLLPQPSHRAGMLCLPFVPVQSESALDVFPWDPPKEKCPMATSVTWEGRGWCHLMTAVPAPCHQHGLISTQTIPGQTPQPHLLVSRAVFFFRDTQG